MLVLLIGGDRDVIRNEEQIAVRLEGLLPHLQTVTSCPALGTH
ncbi:MAG: hypothetical protein R3C44_11765 [Chloroflexota bacterium]